MQAIEEPLQTICDLVVMDYHELARQLCGLMLEHSNPIWQVAPKENIDTYVDVATSLLTKYPVDSAATLYGEEELQQAQIEIEVLANDSIGLEADY